MPAAAPLHRKSIGKAEPANRQWYVADLSGKTLGRAATKIASVLRGKHTARFLPHQDAGDFVVVINADKIKLSGRKWDQKLYHDHSLYPGGLRTFTAKELMALHPTELVTRAVQGMLPKGPLGRRLNKKLKVYTGDKHPHEAQEPKPLAL